METMMEAIDKAIDKKEIAEPWEAHAKVMREIQKEWELDLRHVEQRYTGRGIRSSQISALVMHLIKKGVLHG
ncbi:hypothetical protein KA005_31415 [bacterium]|nr:hypothetical protein [bacterium]